MRAAIRGVIEGLLLGLSLHVLMLLLGLLPGLASPRLTMDLYPSICQAPCTLRVTTRVEPNTENRQLTIELAGDRYSSLSSELLDETSPRTVIHPLYRDVPAGEYEVAVTLQTTGRTYSVARSIHIAGRE